MTVPSQLKDRLVSVISSCREEMAGFLRALVAVPTENPPGRAYADCLALIEQKCREIGLSCEVIAVPGNRNGDTHHTHGDPHPRFCLLAFCGSGRPALYFHGHYDVVPAFSEAQFHPRTTGTKLFGRGAADMKGGLAAMIYAVKAIQACGIKWNGRIGLVIVPDEETGGALGSGYLSRQGLLGEDGIGMLTAEPTSGVVWNASRGALSLRVTVKGKPAHVGLHYRGSNAFERMHLVVEELLRLKKQVQRRKTAFRIEPRAARESILLVGGRCEGGTSFNTVPGECFFTIDRRMNPEEDLKTETKRLMQVFNRLRERGIPVETKVLQQGAPADSAEDGPLARALAGSIRAMTGKAPRFELCPGLLEIRFYQEKGIPAFAYGPGRLEVAHGPNEFVDLKEVERCAAIYALTAIRVLAS